MRWPQRQRRVPCLRGVPLTFRSAEQLHQESRYHRIIRHLERLVVDVDPSLASVIEPYCFRAMDQHLPGVFVAHIERLLQDPAWQGADDRARHEYYSSEDATIENVFRHIGERAIGLHCHDVGTVLGLAKQASLSIDERIVLAKSMEQSLREVGISRRLVDDFRDRVLRPSRRTPQEAPKGARAPAAGGWRADGRVGGHRRQLGEGQDEANPVPVQTRPGLSHACSSRSRPSSA